MIIRFMPAIPIAPAIANASTCKPATIRNATYATGHRFTKPVMKRTFAANHSPAIGFPNIDKKLPKPSNARIADTTHSCHGSEDADTAGIFCVRSLLERLMVDSAEMRLLLLMSFTIISVG